jgi:hypothetical protein
MAANMPLVGSIAAILIGALSAAPAALAATVDATNATAVNERNTHLEATRNFSTTISSFE